MARRKTKHPDTGEEIEVDDDETPAMVAKESVTPERPEETMPTDLEDYEGSYKEISTGEIYGLKKIENDPHGRTHHLKNAEHYWAGTAEEFRKTFEKE